MDATQIPLVGGGSFHAAAPAFTEAVRSWRNMDWDRLCEAVRVLERENPLLPPEAIIAALRRAAWPGR